MLHWSNRDRVLWVISYKKGNRKVNVFRALMNITAYFYTGKLNKIIKLYTKISVFFFIKPTIIFLKFDKTTKKKKN